MKEHQFRAYLAVIRSFCESVPHIYLYGAGTYAMDMAMLLQEMGLPFCGFCVTHRHNNMVASKINCQFPVYELQEIPQPLVDCGFILALKNSFQDEVLGTFAEKHLDLHYLPLNNLFLKYYRQYAVYVSSLSYEQEKSRVRLHEPLAAYKFLPQSDNKQILLCRASGLGDVLCLEPIARQLSKMGYWVFLSSRWRDLFTYERSSVSTVFPWGGVPSPIQDSSIVIDCSDGHEMHPLQHMLDGYASTVSTFIASFEIPDKERIPIYDKNLILRHSCKQIKKICINNEASGWESRIFDAGRMREFAYYLQRKGYELYEIGGDARSYLGVGKNCYGLALHDTVRLMSEMDLYVGIDNGLMHLAQSIRLPVFILFGCTCPNFRIYDWSRARVMWKNVDELPCAACYHRRMIPCREPQCHWETVRCLDWSVEEVIEAFENEKYDNPPKLQDEMYKPIWWAAMDGE
ncbi:MAG: glycosyltransferase family 9 protein [Schwartzia succinivorans]|nr:glycosyltransferase family 9 protein [Schwartzia succinivorans]